MHYKHLWLDLYAKLFKTKSNINIFICSCRGIFLFKIDIYLGMACLILRNIFCFWSHSDTSGFNVKASDAKRCVLSKFWTSIIGPCMCLVCLFECVLMWAWVLFVLKKCVYFCVCINDYVYVHVFCLFLCVCACMHVPGDKKKGTHKNIYKTLKRTTDTF